MKETVIFVDDDKSLIDGLRRMLRPMRDKWEMSFAYSGQEALEKIQTASFNVIVTDMRMPGLTGSELLAKAREVCPSSVRIILSGQAEQDVIINSVSHTHQYLSKPCEADELIKVISRTSRLRDYVKNLKLREFISRLDFIPCVPKIYDAVLNQLQSKKPEIESISMSIAGDIGLSSKLLQLVNSAFFGPKTEVLCAHKAVGMMGIDLLKKLFLEAGIFNKAETVQIGFSSLTDLNQTGITVGNLARRIAILEGVPSARADGYSTAGMLHKIGRIVLALYQPEKYAGATRSVNEAGLADRELEMFGTNHIQVGAYLLGLWGLSDLIIDSVLEQQGFESVGADNGSSPQTTMQLAIFISSLLTIDRNTKLETESDLAYYRKLYAQQHSSGSNAEALSI